MPTIRYCDWTNGFDCVVKQDRTTAIAAWSAATTYANGQDAHDNAAYPNRKVYISIQAGNLNHALSDAAWWTLKADGSNTLPYQSITEASQGLTGGDEVRVAKSPANTALTGTLTFTAGSTTLTGSSTLFTTELVVGDFVKGNDNHWYEVVTITSNTAAVLYKVYPSSTASGVSSFKLGVTSTGAAASSSTQVQIVSSSGSSAASRLKISGGWNLATPAIDGETWFRQMHGTFATRNGYGLWWSSKNYIEWEGINFLRYNIGLGISTTTGSLITSLVCNSNLAGVNATGFSSCIITSIICNSNNAIGINGTFTASFIGAIVCNGNYSHGVSLASTFNITIDSLECIRNGGHGIWGDNSCGYYIASANCSNNTSHGIRFSSSGNVIIGTAISNSNSTYGVYLGRCFDIVIADLTANSNTTNAFGIETFNSYNIVYKLAGTGNIAATKVTQQSGQNPQLSIQDNNGGGSKNYFSGGETYSDTTDARSGTCLKYDVNSATDWMVHVFKMKVALSTAYTVTFYVKKDASFSGDIEAAIYNMGKEVVAYASKEPTGTGAYEAMTISIADTDILAAGIAELRIRARGTAGNCFVDDISIA